MRTFRAMLIAIAVVVAMLLPALGAHADEWCGELRGFKRLPDINICIPAP